MSERNSQLLELAPILLTILAVIILISGGVNVPGQDAEQIDPASTNLADLRKLVRLGNRPSCTDAEYKNELISTAENGVLMTIEIEWRTIGQEPVVSDQFEVAVPAQESAPILFEPPGGQLEEAITSCGVNIMGIEVVE